MSRPDDSRMIRRLRAFIHRPHRLNRRRVRLIQLAALSIESRVYPCSREISSRDPH